MLESVDNSEDSDCGEKVTNEQRGNAKDVKVFQVAGRGVVVLVGMLRLLASFAILMLFDANVSLSTAIIITPFSYIVLWNIVRRYVIIRRSCGFHKFRANLDSSRCNLLTKPLPKRFLISVKHKLRLNMI